MAIGFTDLTSTVRRPDKSMSRKSTPVRHTIKFGDGYEQRLANGINNLQEEYGVSFSTRTKAEIDDIIAFFENKGGVTSFTYTVPDTNESGNEVAIKVVCEEWNKTYDYGDYYSASATFRRVYEA
jgi:phage-related protein